MKCKLDSANLKTWSRIITSLTMIGDEEIHFAFTDSTVTLTVFNNSLSVSATCTFFSTFFQTFNIPRGYCKTFKLPAKCIMKPFRSLRFITKSCVFCEIAFENEGDKVVVTMGCKSLTEIRYTIKMLDDMDDMHAECDPEKLCNWIRTEPKFMINNLNHFTGKGLMDLTLMAQGNKVLMKNCATDLLRKEGKIYTEVTLSTSAFERFAINADTEVTFQHRDFKTFFALAEHMKLPITLHFQGPADPVILTIKNELLEATLLLATKYVDENDMAQSSQISTGLSNGISNTSSVEEDPPVPVRQKKNDRVVELEPFEGTDNEEERAPPRKKTRELFARINAPYDIYKQFPGHDIVLVRGSDEEDE